MVKWHISLQCIFEETCCFIRRRHWHPTPVLLPGKSHGQRNLVGCSPWGHYELDTTEWLHFHFHALEKEMATHSSVLAWRIPGTEEPGGLLSMGLHRVGHDWSDLAAAAGTLNGILCNSQNIRNIFCFCFLAMALPTLGNITWIVEQKDLFPTGLDPQRRRG